MAYKGGTDAVQEFIKKYTESGFLLDVYSPKWLDTHESFSYFNVDDLDEYQERSGGACEGHMLILFTGKHNSELETDLANIYAPFEKVFGSNAPHHKPDLLLINLATQQILCMGLGRKNQFFCYHLKDEIIHLREHDFFDALLGWYKHTEITPSTDYIVTQTFVSNFVKYDYANIAAYLKEALEDFGVQASRWDHLPLNEEAMKIILDEGPDANGLYVVDCEEMTEEEVRKIKSELEESEATARENLDTFEEFFVEIYWEDLSTGDY